MYSFNSRLYVYSNHSKKKLKYEENLKEKLY